MERRPTEPILLARVESAPDELFDDPHRSASGSDLQERARGVRRDPLLDHPVVEPLEPAFGRVSEELFRLASSGWKLGPGVEEDLHRFAVRPPRTAGRMRKGQSRFAYS
jgi:hypothetical protein